MFVSLIFGCMEQEVSVTTEEFLAFLFWRPLESKGWIRSNSVAQLLQACSFLSGGVTLLLWWPDVLEFLVLSGYVGDCSSCLVYPGLGKWFVNPCPRACWRELANSPALLWIPQACEGGQMVGLSSEPPLYVMMKNDQPPGKWKSGPKQLWILVNDFETQSEGRNCFLN